MAGYEGWAVVELMGHRTRPGRVSEVEAYGVKQLRVDIPIGGGEVTEFYGGASIYSVRPCSEELARDAAKDQWDLKPVRPVGYQLEHHEDFTNSAANLSADLEKVQTELDQREQQVGLIVEALKPLADLARAHRYDDEKGIVAFKSISGTDRYADVEVRHLRALIRAAGLWTDEMQARPPNIPGPEAKSAGETVAPPPAEPTGEDTGDPGVSGLAHRDNPAGTEFDDETPF